MRKQPGQRGLFEYRGQWIGEEPGRAGYYRYWYENGSRRVKRKALAAIDLQSAKEELVGLLGQVPAPTKDPANVSLTSVLVHYRDNYAEPRGSRQFAAARRAAELALLSAESIVSDPTVASLTRTNQRRMWAWMAENAGISAKSISTYMILVRAAVNFAATPQIVTTEVGEEEVRLLSAAVPIFCNQEEIAGHIGGTVSQPRDYIPTFEDLGRWLDAIEEEDDFRFAIIMLNTCARNEAIFDLRTSQINWEFGTIDLNPPGRRQTKKRRPVLRMTTGLAAWLKHWGGDRPISQYQDTVEKRLNKLGKPFVDDAGVEHPGLGMPEMTCYTLRHFIATNMRRVSFPVSKEQRSLWLGHTVKEGSKTTDWYEKFDPDYLEQPMRATEEIIRKLQKHTKRKLFAPTVRSQGRLRIVK